MRYRNFGNTGLRVSELAFGAWAIGGKSYGAVDASHALRALGRAEELGVNFIDTAATYGQSERLIGRFLRGRRDRWILATKYSGQPEGMSEVLEAQLRRLGTSWVDLYQIHWAPKEDQAHLYDELEALKRSGKVRFTGVSLYSAADIDYVLSKTAIDGMQIAFGLLDPEPLLSCLDQVTDHGLGVIVRSCLKDGFLTGKYGPGAVFTDPDDQRTAWDRRKIIRLARAASRFGFLEEQAGSMLTAALNYPLAFHGVSTVLISTKNEKQASLNYTQGGLWTCGPEGLSRITEVQDRLGLLNDTRWGGVRRLADAKRKATGWLQEVLRGR